MLVWTYAEFYPYECHEYIYKSKEHLQKIQQPYLETYCFRDEAQ